MEYSNEFTFYLLGAGKIFDDELSKYNSKEEVPSYHKKDFAPIVDIAVKHNVFEDEKMYSKEEMDKLLGHIRESAKAEELEKRFKNIISSHMGYPVLYYLCAYSNSPRNKRDQIEKEINIYLNINNIPLEGFPDTVKKKKIK
jgi:hypothetical protein